MQTLAAPAGGIVTRPVAGSPQRFQIYLVKMDDVDGYDFDSVVIAESEEEAIAMLQPDSQFIIRVSCEQVGTALFGPSRFLV